MPKDRPIVEESEGLTGPLPKVLIGAFVFIIAIVPIIQPVYELTASDAGKTETQPSDAPEQEHLGFVARVTKVSKPPVPGTTPYTEAVAFTEYELIRRFEVQPDPAETPPAEDAPWHHKLQELDILRDWPTLKNIQKYEDELAEESIVAELARPYTQWLQLKLQGKGNEKAVPGKDGWLFFRTGVYYSISPDIRSKFMLTEKANNQDVADPLPAIVDFHHQLKKKDIKLLLVPISPKAVIHPEMLWSRYDLGRGPAVNQSESAFYAKLREETKKASGEEIDILDLTDAMWEWKKQSTEPLYMPLDTHWTPDTMDRFAKALAAEVRKRLPKLSRNDITFVQEPVKVTNKGDVYGMMKLPEWSKEFEPSTFTVSRIVDPTTDKGVTSDPQSEIALLGDSFTNVFSMQDQNMQWGANSAGLGEHLMLHLKRRIQVFAVNGGAATATRRQLVRAGLAGKKLVIWSFVKRDFVDPDREWKVLPLGGTATAGNRFVAIEKVLIDNKLTDAANLKVGDEVRLTLRDWKAILQEQPVLRKIQQLDDTENFTGPFYWVAKRAPAE